MQVFMGQAWADHNQDFMARAIRADRITFADMGVVRRIGREWDVERESPEAMAFVLTFQTVARRMVAIDRAEAKRPIGTASPSA